MLGYNRTVYLRSRISDLSKNILLVSQLYNSREYDGILYFAGKDVNTQVFFSGGLELGHDDAELREFFNSYGARMIAERIELQSELTAILVQEDYIKRDGDYPNNINA